MNRNRRQAANHPPKRMFFLKLRDFEDLASWIIGVALLLSAIPHFGNPYYFLGSVYSYDLVGAGLAQLVAMVLPMLQLLLAACLITRLFRPGAHLIVLPMLLGFAILQTSAKLRGLDIACGCFGPNEDAIGWFSLTVVYGLLTLSIVRNAAYGVSLRNAARRDSANPTSESA
jgi:putative oxidoreductase